MSYKYIVTDSRNAPLASALLESPVTAPVWQIRVLDDQASQVLEHEFVHLIGMEASAPAKTGRVLDRRGDLVALEPIGPLAGDIRRHLRIPARFDSLLYPVTGDWKGRVPVVNHDLSCGGAAFYCDRGLRIGEVVELVIPITAQPLLIRAVVLRLRPSNSDKQLYSVKFIDLTAGEETALQAAVFDLQLQRHGQPNRT